MESTKINFALWWVKMGKWQAVTTAITLAAFFITLYITGNEIKAIIALGIIAVVALLVGYTLGDFNRDNINAGNKFFAFSFIAAITGLVTFAFSTAKICEAPPAVIALFVFSVVCLIAFVIIMATMILKENKDSTISKKVIWLSYTAEFIIIFVPILTTILI